MTYIHRADELVAQGTGGTGKCHERRVILKNWAITRTSGAIPSTSAGVWLRDCAQSVVMLCFEQLVECCRNYRQLEVRGTASGVSERTKIRSLSGRSRSESYLSPDSISNTRRLGSSERRAARTQPAVPTGDNNRLGDQGGGRQRETRLLRQ